MTTEALNGLCRMLQANGSTQEIKQLAMLIGDGRTNSALVSYVSSVEAKANGAEAKVNDLTESVRWLKDRVNRLENQLRAGSH